MNLTTVLSLLVISVLAYRFRFHLQYFGHQVSFQPEWQIGRSLRRQVSQREADRSYEESRRYLADFCARRVGLRTGSSERVRESHMEIVIDGPILMVWFSESVPGRSRHIPRLKRIFEIDLKTGRFKVVSRHPKPFFRRKSSGAEEKRWQGLELFGASLGDVLGKFPAYFALTGEYLPEDVEQPWLTTRKKIVAGDIPAQCA